MINSNQTKQQILASWSKGGAETDESTKILFFKDDSSLESEIKNPEIWDNLSDNGKLSLETYIRFRDSKRFLCHVLSVLYSVLLTQ